MERRDPASQLISSLVFQEFPSLYISGAKGSWAWDWNIESYTIGIWDGHKISKPKSPFIIVSYNRNLHYPNIVSIQFVDMAADMDNAVVYAHWLDLWITKGPIH